MSLQFQLARFEEEPVLGIIRGVSSESVDGVLEAALTGGLRVLEITLNTEKAFEIIERIAKNYGQSICLGAGTVLSVHDARRAREAGAQFLVGPTLNDLVAEYSREESFPYFPGAFTPTEIEKSWNAGGEMVKVFPASRLGPEYFKEVKGPFPDIKLLAVGGVSPSNVGDYLAAGAAGVAFGGSVFSVSRMESKQFSLIRKDIEDFLLAVRNFYTKIC